MLYIATYHDKNGEPVDHSDSVSVDDSTPEHRADQTAISRLIHCEYFIDTITTETGRMVLDKQPVKLRRGNRREEIRQGRIDPPDWS